MTRVAITIYGVRDDIYILDFELCNGFLTSCFEVTVDGFSFGFAPDGEAVEALNAARREIFGLDPFELSLGPRWEQTVVGDFTVD